MTLKLSSTILTVLLLSGCASTPLIGTSADVKEINAAEAKSCTFVQSFIVKTEDPLAKNPGNDAKDIAMNRTNALGGNAFLVRNEAFLPSPINVGSVVELSGDAYTCPPAKS